MSWVAVAIGGTALVGAGASIYSSEKAGDIASKSIPKYTKSQEELFARLMDEMQGSFTRSPTGQESSYQKFLEDYPNWARRATSEAYNPEYIKKMYAEGIRPEFEANVIPEVKEAYAGPGYWGSQRAKGVSDAWSGLGYQEAKDIGGVESQRQDTLMKLLGQQPVMERASADWSKYLREMQDPWTSSKWQMAMSLLDKSPYQVVAGMAPQAPNYVTSFLDAYAKAGYPGFSRSTTPATSSGVTYVTGQPEWNPSTGYKW